MNSPVRDLILIAFRPPRSDPEPWSALPSWRLCLRKAQLSPSTSKPSHCSCAVFFSRLSSHITLTKPRRPAASLIASGAGASSAFASKSSEQCGAVFHWAPAASGRFRLSPQSGAGLCFGLCTASMQFSELSATGGRRSVGRRVPAALLAEGDDLSGHAATFCYPCKRPTSIQMTTNAGGRHSSGRRQAGWSRTRSCKTCPNQQQRSNEP